MGATAASLVMLAVLAGGAHDDWVHVMVDLAPARPFLASAGKGRAEVRGGLVRQLRAQLDRSLQALSPQLARWERAGQVRKVRGLWINQSLVFDARAALVEELRNRGWRVRADAVVKLGQLDPSEPSGIAGWNLEAIHAPEAWAQGWTGQGAVVAILDSGVDAAHPDLAPGFRGRPGDWFDAFGELAAPADLVGHGTQVAGLAVGGGTSGVQVGVAPGAKWIAARVFDAAGRTTLSALHAGLQWVLDPDGDPATDDSPDVVNGSWSLGNVGQCSAEFHADLVALRAAGILPVFAAGGYGPGAGTSVSPANDPLAIPVAASDSLNQADPQGSHGPSACGGGAYPALTAPGTAVWTTDVSIPGTASYTTVSGSSMAAPHVSGALAILVGAFPGRSPGELEAALAEATEDLGEDGADFESGSGLADVFEASLALAERAGRPSISNDVRLRGPRRGAASPSAVLRHAAQR